MCATARTLWGSLCSLKRGLFALVAASSMLSARRTSVCLCVCVAVAVAAIAVEDN